MATVKTTLDPNNLPKPSKEALARLDAIGETEIDYSDIPELDDRFFKKATKSSVTVRLDSDMVEWFKSHGKGYQTRMNAVLRAFYEHHQSK